MFNFGIAWPLTGFLPVKIELFMCRHTLYTLKQGLTDEEYMCVLIRHGISQVSTIYLIQPNMEGKHSLVYNIFASRNYDIVTSPNHKKAHKFKYLSAFCFWCIYQLTRILTHMIKQVCILLRKLLWSSMGENNTQLEKTCVVVYTRRDSQICIPLFHPTKCDVLTWYLPCPICPAIPWPSRSIYSDPTYSMFWEACLGGSK